MSEPEVIEKLQQLAKDGAPKINKKKTPKYYFQAASALLKAVVQNKKDGDLETAYVNAFAYFV
jgi:hypothetical protein